MEFEAKMDIVRELMFALAQTKEWAHIEREDPMICESERRFEAAKERIVGKLSVDDENDLSEAMQSVISAYTNAAILFGMKTADALREATAQPATLSQYNLDCLIAIENQAEQRSKMAKAS